jgi:prefoldin subunit 5
VEMKPIKEPAPLDQAIKSLSEAIETLDEMIETMQSSAATLRGWLEPGKEIGWIDENK